jgi:hypothetical protein
MGCNRDTGGAPRIEQALMIKTGVKTCMIFNLDATEITFGADLFCLLSPAHHGKGLAQMLLSQGEFARHCLIHC